MKEKINVTKTFLPDKQKFLRYIDQIWDSSVLTNQGPLLNEFEKRLKNFLNIENIQFLTNGTLPLQIAIRALEIDGEIITTPFSYVATLSSILWEKCHPVFADIESDNFTIDANKIESLITPKTKAILAVHCFGFPCDINKIESIAKKHNLKVIYDGAHAFGCEYLGKSLLGYGDISTCSFHATKLFHTIEGGLIFASDKIVNKKVDLMKRFGHIYDDHFSLGINAKASEFQSAMGLCNIDYIDEIIANRKISYEIYLNELKDRFFIPKISPNLKYNYGYFPILMNDENQLKELVLKLNNENIFPRRYFFPSLNKLEYLENKQNCPISENIASRILCLPLYFNLNPQNITEICKIIKKTNL